MSSYMQDIPVRNTELLNILNKYRDLLTRDKDQFVEDFHRSCKEQKDNRHWLVGDGHLQEILDQGERHEGFPDYMYGYEMSVNRKKHQFFAEDTHPTVRRDRTAEISNINRLITQWLGVRTTALTAYYPPGGFISWHNNANASAYNLIFTWSEEGNGQFDYVDPRTKEVVSMPDKVGWQCKAAYFGNYGEKDRLFYHCAKTDCWRLTVSFTFDTSSMSEDYRADLIDEISSEE